MEYSYKKIYTDFNEFYNDGFNIVQDIKSKTIGMLANERVDFARNYIIKDIMNSFINTGTISETALLKINSSSNILKFSMDNLVKKLKQQKTEKKILLNPFI